MKDNDIIKFSKRIVFKKRIELFFRDLNLTYLLIALVFIFSTLVLINRNILFYLSFNMAFFSNYYLWQLITYPFLNASNSLNLIITCFMIYFIGLPIERYLGKKDFFLSFIILHFFYALSTLALFFILNHYNLYRGPFLLSGLSIFINFVLMYYCCINPKASISLWGIIPVSIKIFALLLIFFNLITPFENYNLSSSFNGIIGFILNLIYLKIKYKLNFFAIFVN